ncbi:C2H2-type domain-containing protein [Plasmodiophora brassicae]|uniref:C2H2-type domain-containing protein n=1 Tax=Plasmodiophora brassicae TaxID=37360 RepID=A0A0G4J0Q9_PLABS|nr:hypothetical protein PBRA_008208 [Plasmodiophora brassicae]SPR01203.1 unnamed protein product [Plasmodiophora brassicae]
MVEPQIIMMPTTMEAATVTVDDGRSLDAAVYEYLVACELPDLAATFWQTPRPATALTQTALARAWNEACSCNAKRAPDAGLSLSAVRSAVSPGEVRIVAPNIQRSRPQPERKRHYCTEPGCTASFTKKGNLRRHIDLHLGNKPFICVETLDDGMPCGRRFSRRADLDSHLRSHSGERPYQCSICNKLFTRNSDWRIHVKTTHGIAPYNCFVETCQYRCHTQKELRLHLVESHPNVRMSNGSFEIVVDCPTNDVNGEPLIINREGCIDPSVGHPSKQPINAPNVLYNGCMGHLESALQVRHDDHIDFLIDGELHHLNMDGQCENHGVYTGMMHPDEPMRGEMPIAQELDAPGA